LAGGDSNDPGDPFPDVAGVYEIDGTLRGSLLVHATLGDDIFNISDDAVSTASVSPERGHRLHSRRRVGLLDVLRNVVGHRDDQRSPYAQQQFW